MRKTIVSRMPREHPLLQMMYQPIDWKLLVKRITRLITTAKPTLSRHIVDNLGT